MTVELDISQLHDVCDTRALVPELILTGSKRMSGMVKFQMLTYLAQNILEREDYKFDGSAYLPYSEDLVCDIESNYSKADRQGITIKSTDEHCHYSIDAERRQVISEYSLTQRTNQAPIFSRIQYILAAMQFSEYKMVDFLETVYSEYKSGMDGSVENTERILKGIDRATPPIESIFEKHYTRESIQILAGTDNIKNIMNNINKSNDPIQNKVICNISMAMIENCVKISDKLESAGSEKTIQPAGNTSNPQLLMICELDEMLASYAAAKKIIRNPYTMKLNEILRGDKKRLSVELSKIEILKS